MSRPERGGARDKRERAAARSDGAPAARGNAAPAGPAASGTDDAAFLLSIFLMEAWDTVATIELALDGLGRSGGARGWAETPLTLRLSPLIIVTHRLKGAASLHGFPRVAALGGEMERLLESPLWSSSEGRRSAIDRLALLVLPLKELLDAIAVTGRELEIEIPDPIPDASDRAAAASGETGGAAENTVAPAHVTPPAADHTAGESFETIERPGIASRVPEPIVARDPDVDAFLTENPEIAAFFVPEATEHLETMTTALLALERDGAARDELGALLRAVHTLKGAAYTVGCAPIGDLAHQIEDTLVAVRQGQAPLTPPLVQALFEGVDALKLMLGLSTRSEDVDSRTPVAPAPQPIAVEIAFPGAGTAMRPRPMIRIGLERLDALMNIVGELVVARSRLDQRLEEFDGLGRQLAFHRTRLSHTVRDFETKYLDPHVPGTHPSRVPSGGRDESVLGTGTWASAVLHEPDGDRYDDFTVLARRMGEISADVSELHTQLAALVRGIREDTARIQRLTRELRSGVGRARRLPIGGLFRRFARHVRDCALAAGKSVTLELSGEAVEVDNAIVEQIADPLLSLIKSAIAHRIEMPDVREAKGKPRHAVIRLAASVQGTVIVLSVEDDGAGIDGRGVGRDREAYGVDLDAVQASIRRQDGEVTVDDGAGGTRFTITLPSSVIIVDALMVRAGGATFALALAAVAATTRIPADELRRRGEPLRVGEHLVHPVALDEALGLPPLERGRAVPLLVLRPTDKPTALVVDELLGKEEIVIKPLGPFLEGVGPFAGATISGDGRVILLLDPSQLVSFQAPARRGGTEAETAGAPVPSLVPATGPGRLLLVDDSISVRKIVGTMLERAGFSVVTASDGIDALETLARVSVDAVITDLEMPRLNGYELIEDLRRRPALRHMPVVILTTRSGERHVNLARQLGVRHYATKPVVDEDTFVSLMKSIIGVTSGHAQTKEAEVGEASAR